MSFESLVSFFAEYPYVGVLIIFVLCGLGLPLPEEIVLLAAGFICYSNPEVAPVWGMIIACAASILAGDLIPFALGKIFGTRLLRLRPLRVLVTRDRLAQFDRWFRKRGDLVIFFARFIPGIRVVAFFTAGTMKMTWRRFLFLDGLGIVMLVPLLVYLPYRFGAEIEELIEGVKGAERSILWTAFGAAVIAGLWWWLRRRRARKAATLRPEDTFVEPREPIGPRRPEVDMPSDSESETATSQLPQDQPLEDVTESERNSDGPESQDA